MIGTGSLDRRIHPGWFAIMLQRVYAAVRERPPLDGIKVISGPLEGLEVSNNGAVAYLRETYRAGKRFYGWGQPGRPFPFDGVGYHLYVQQGYTADRLRTSAPCAPSSPDIWTRCTR